MVDFAMQSSNCDSNSISIIEIYDLIIKNKKQKIHEVLIESTMKTLKEIYTCMHVCTVKLQTYPTIIEQKAFICD